MRFAFRDAEAIEKALVDTMGVPVQNIIFEKNLSKGALEYWFGTERESGQLAARVKGSDSELIVYFAGHGSKFDAEGLDKPIPYLLGTDTRPEALRRTGYSLNTLKDNLRKIKKNQLTNGRVMLVLESCFSGSYNDGDLITGRSAPAFGRPTAVVTSSEEKVDNFVVLAAAQGDQFAVWDNKWERSVFTDALVSGLYGEADDTRFKGNNDGAVTLGELQSFVSKRIERRLRATGITSRQDPVINGKADMALVNTGETDGVWPDLVERSGNEKLESDILMQSRDTAGIERYLDNCLYCFNQLKLKQIVRDVQQSATICSIEDRWLGTLTGASALTRLEAYLKTGRCDRLKPRANKLLVKLRFEARMAKLKERRSLAKAARVAARLQAEREAEYRRQEAELLAKEEKDERKRLIAKRERDKAEKLRKRQQQLAEIAADKERERIELEEQRKWEAEQAALDALANKGNADVGAEKKVAALNTVPGGQDNGVEPDPAVKKISPKEAWEAKALLARRLQTELKRVGCLYGRVDGVWGRGSNGALDRFVKTAGVDVVGVVPSEDAIEVVSKIQTTVCKAPPKKTYVKKKTPTKKVARKKWKQRAKPKVVYEIIEEKPRYKKKKRARKKVTYTAPKKTYKAPKKKYYAPKKTYRAPKKTYSGGGSSGGGVKIERQCARYGNFC